MAKRTLFFRDALFKTFAPEEASTLMKRLEIHHTPKYGSWLKNPEN
jgi:hypothetical protein